MAARQRLTAQRLTPPLYWLMAGCQTQTGANLQLRSRWTLQSQTMHQSPGQRCWRQGLRQHLR